MPVKVKLSHIIENLDSPGDEFCSFLNRRTGQVVMVSAEELARAEEGESDDDSELSDEESFQEAVAIIEDEDGIYVGLPDQYEINEYGFMEEFCYEIKELKIRNILLRTIQGKGAFRRFKDAVHELEIQDDWYAFRERKLKEVAVEWLQDHQIEFVDDVSSPDMNPGGKLKEALKEEDRLKPGRYRHFKGGEYEVIAVAKHSETQEEYVVYRALYGDGAYWVRPKGMFVEKLMVEGKMSPRFEYVGDVPKDGRK